MNPISEQEISALADAVRRRHRACGADVATLATLETHMYRVAAFVDDLSEAESLNALEYMQLRTAATLHDAARAKARPAVSAAASSALAEEMLIGIGADPDFADVVATTIRRHAGGLVLDGGEGEAVTDMPETHVEQLLHDACLLARIVEWGGTASEAQLRDAAKTVCTQAGQRLAARILDEIRAGTVAPIG